MPHAVIEYSNTIAFAIAEAKIVDRVHDIMLNAGLFAAEAIKTRSVGVADWMVGTKGRDGTFIHLCVSILSGRTVEQRQTLSETLVSALGNALPGIDQITVEIRDMDKDTYRKYNKS